MNMLGANGNYNPGGRGPSNVIAFPSFQQLFGAQANAIAARVWSSLPGWAAREAATAGLNAEAMKTIFEVQADLMINKRGAWIILG